MDNIVINILLGAWQVLLESAPFMLFGFFVAGLLKALVPDDFVARHLGNGKGKASAWPVVKAAALGVPLPLCSCGVIPAAAGLRTQGASKGATTSFLISTPETGVDSMAVTYALLDPLMTVARPVAAFVSSLVAGFVVDAVDPEDSTDPAERNLQAVQGCGSACGCGHDHDHGHVHEIVQEPEGCGCSSGSCAAPAPGNNTLAARLRRGMSFAFGDLLTDIGNWFLAGVFIAGAVSALVPAEFVSEHLGSGIVPMLAMLALSLPMYVCATASTPIAAALVLKGLSPGAGLVFLLAGPATNAATILVVARMLGKRAAMAYVSVVAVVALVMGFVVDAIYAATGISAAEWAASSGQEVLGGLALPSAVVLLALIVRPHMRRTLRYMMPSTGQ